MLTPTPLSERLGQEMDRFFDLDGEVEAKRQLRRASSTGRPLDAADWVKRLEAATGRRLSEPPIGRPRRPAMDGLETPPLI